MELTPQRRLETTPGTKQAAARAAERIMAQRRFAPWQMDAFCDHMCKALGLDGASALPDVFRVPAAVPLRIGIKADLCTRYAVPADRKDPRRRALEKALKLYYRSLQYQHAILDGGRRFTLDLKPAQPITGMDRDRARHHLAGFHERRNQKS